MRDFKFINARRDRLLKTGAAFIAIARDEYDYDPSDRTHSTMGNGIKKALGLIDNPFKNGKPKFKFRVSEDETAKFTAEKTAGNLSDTDTADNLSDTDEDYEPSNNASNEFSPHENSG